MYKRYHDSSRRRLEFASIFVFMEVSSGVYYVVKDKLGELASYVGYDTVTTMLNTEHKVTVMGIDKIYTNFKLER